ncbi:MAG TPA: RagB/SusD family nutrient uptake outer membrane protein, partial [Chitinophaga sp.]
RVGDTAIFMPGYDVTDAQIAAAPYKLMPPRTYTTALSPAMFKYFDTKRADMNYPSIRPVIVFRLADTYLMAAEALFMDGRAGDAVTYINAIRRRAAYPGGNPQTMEVTAANLSLDFILDERSRELCGELTRWLDLVRTGKLLERVRLHNNDGRSNIQAKHVLRPIPQTQIDAVTTGPEYPQNAGW